MTELKPCPFCGKKPKIHYYPVNMGWAGCKSIFGKHHLQTKVIFDMPSQLEASIIEAWNKEVTKCTN